ncbi:MAG: hypothetical protein A2Y12_09385 [Planctomycetes bacterium GWF2_42_9]|nr:MAG: hypothetical protein A2Y12_09385 [Planctomycetes bacterium GWF2_42_9]
MSKKIDLPGHIYPKRGRFYWRVRLPGEQNFKNYALVPEGMQKAYAVSNESDAIEIARRMYLLAVNKCANVGKFDGTIASLVQFYMAHIHASFPNDSGEPKDFERAYKYLVTYHGNERVIDLTPQKLKALRKSIATETRKTKNKEVPIVRSITTINRWVRRICRAFTWGISEGYAPAHIAYALESLEPLNKTNKIAGAEVKDPMKVKPVDPKHVEVILPYVGPVVADMLRLQLITGMRSNEICILRPADIVKREDYWIYYPTKFKNTTHDQNYVREVIFGKLAQALLIPYLLRNHEDFCFKPEESEKKRRALIHAKRETPMNKGNKPGVRCVAQEYSPCYNAASYYKAVQRGIEAARKDGHSVPDWHPHQIRHAVTDKISAQVGEFKAKAALGHKTLDATLIYRQMERENAIEIAKRLG